MELAIFTVAVASFGTGIYFGRLWERDWWIEQTRKIIKHVDRNPDHARQLVFRLTEKRHSTWTD